jgi:4a-hydroxytetrahydrobiopterin dehydratase
MKLEEATMTEDLSKKKCTPCEEGAPPLEDGKIQELLLKLDGDWKVIDNHHLEKEYDFKNFREALSFTNGVGEAAEEEGHHPEILLGWGKVKLKLHTHKADGLTENDFILASRADEITKSGD